MNCNIAEPIAAINESGEKKVKAFFIIFLSYNIAPAKIFSGFHEKKNI